MKKLVLSFMAVFFAIGVMAADYNYSLSPYLGYHFFSDERDMKDKPEIGLKVERFLNENLGFEIGLGYVPTKKDSDGSNNDMLQHHIHLKYYLMEMNKLKPYVAGGLGGDLTRGMNIGPSLAIGARYDIKENMGVFGELRDNFLFGDGNDVIAMVGLSFYIGKKTKPILDSDGDGVNDNLDKCPNTPKGVKVDSEGCPLDSDKDGVYDYLDKCPGTPNGVKVDKDGCPLDSDKDGVYDYLDKCPGTPEGVKVDKDGCPLDSDKDGVYDYLDKCPGTPNGVKVDKDGCPLDSDKDGVFDGLDKCPGTPKGSIVDKDGCELSISLLIHFDTNKAVVKEEYYDEIEKVANFMKNHPDIKIEIAGHTDSRGDRNKNIELSQSRAEAVMEVLITKFGIEKSKISAKGYGPDKPVDTNETEEGRSKNRRVEAVIIK
ncbi:MAG: OmpA family protein [Calditerrivibrio sp.]|nr:OmpA family protein [Calditerrivibrio sp.]